MNLLKTAVISVCFTAIAVGIIESLLPDSSFKPQIRLITGAVIMLALIVPLFSVSKVKLPQFDTQNVTVNAGEQLSRAAALSAKNEIAAYLRQNNVDEAKITVFTDIGEDNCIVINKASVSVAKEDIDKAASAAKAAEENLGYDIEIDALG